MRRNGFQANCNIKLSASSANRSVDTNHQQNPHASKQAPQSTSHPLQRKGAAAEHPVPAAALYCFSREVMERRINREEPDERKEGRLITIAEGNALDELDSVIESLELTGRNRERGMIDQAIHTRFFWFFPSLFQPAADCRMDIPLLSVNPFFLS